MNVVRRAAPLVLAAFCVAAVVLLAERSGRSRGAAPAAALRATTSLSARSTLFGEPVVARVAVLVDPARVDLDRVSVQARFAPYRLSGPPSVTRSRGGALAVERLAYRLQCVDPACAPLAPQRTVSLPAVVVRYGARAARVPWPSLTVSSRLSPGDVAGGALRLPASTPVAYRISPRVLGWTLAALAAVLFAGAGVAASRLLASRRTIPSLSPLERALSLVSHAVSWAIEERRAALDALAVALRDEGAEPLASTSRRLAWSRPEPEGDAMAELVAAVRGQESEGRP